MGVNIWCEYNTIENKYSHISVSHSSACLQKHTHNTPVNFNPLIPGISTLEPNNMTNRINKDPILIALLALWILFVTYKTIQQAKTPEPVTILGYTLPLTGSWVLNYIILAATGTFIAIAVLPLVGILVTLGALLIFSFLYLLSFTSDVIVVVFWCFLTMFLKRKRYSHEWVPPSERQDWNERCKAEESEKLQFANKIG
jgi:hypothetical protein